MRGVMASVNCQLPRNNGKIGVKDQIQLCISFEVEKQLQYSAARICGHLTYVVSVWLHIIIRS